MEWLRCTVCGLAARQAAGEVCPVCGGATRLLTAEETRHQEHYMGKAIPGDVLREALASLAVESVPLV
jgi:hypothetical protein